MRMLALLALVFVYSLGCAPGKPRAAATSYSDLCAEVKTWEETLAEDRKTLDDCRQNLEWLQRSGLEPTAADERTIQILNKLIAVDHERLAGAKARRDAATP